MGSWRHYLCRMCEVGEVSTGTGRGRAILHAHQVEPDPDWLARVDRARVDLARQEVPA
jgi:hypothetical protein